MKINDSIKIELLLGHGFVVVSSVLLFAQMSGLAANISIC